jgi:transcriptional regulator with GAF, ATPase, and Fis domain
MLTDPLAKNRQRHADLRARGYDRPTVEELRARYLALRASAGLMLWDTEEGAELYTQLSGQSVRAGPRSAYVFAGPDSISRLWDVADHVDYGDMNFLVLGERGSGKEAIAHLVAEAARAPTVINFNCATLVETLAVGQLFGVAAGAASGVSARRGLVKRAEGGVLFLDEFFAAPPSMFPQLLRLLEQRTYSQIGREEEELPFSGWIVAASNRYPTEAVIEAAVDAGEVPGDLVDRFSARIEVPPLRARRAEIPAIAENILRGLHEGRAPAFPFVALDSGTAARLATIDYDWPGNIRELRRLLLTEGRLRRHGASDGDRLRIPDEDLTRLMNNRALATDAGGAIDARGARMPDEAWPPASTRVAPPSSRRGVAGPASSSTPQNPFDRQEVRRQRLKAIVVALTARMQREGRTKVDPRWVSGACEAIWGIERAAGQKLKRTVGLDCTGIAELLNGEG